MCYIARTHSISLSEKKLPRRKKYYVPIRYTFIKKSEFNVSTIVKKEDLV